MSGYSLNFLAVSWDYDCPWAKVFLLTDNPTNRSGPRRFFRCGKKESVAPSLFSPRNRRLRSCALFQARMASRPEILEEDFQNRRSIETTLADCSHVIVQVAGNSGGLS